jgi:NCS1 family nucleobase:cation symporter-1
LNQTERSSSTMKDALSGPDLALSNPDLAPTTPEQRTWGLWHFAALWVGMSVCIPTYMLAASMIASGLDWRESLIILTVGNAIVLLPMLVTGHAGTRYGIPFPVFARASYGVRGAHLPALLRSLVACGWFGIQTWVGGLAISALVGTIWPGWLAIGHGIPHMGHAVPEFLGFLLFWLINLYFVWNGTESIKWLETLSAPFLIVTGIALLWWAAARAGGLGAALAATNHLVGTTGGPRGGFVVGVLVPWLTAMVGYWATLALNIPDFTRFARTQRDQAVGQTLGLLTTMPLFAFIGIAVTGATMLLYGEPIWNPVDLLARLTRETGSPLLGILALVVLVVATLTTNIAANIVSPANSFSNLAPGTISVRAGGVVASVIGVLLFPWVLLDRYQTWLISYSGLLGAVGGVIVCDYLVVRRGRLDVSDLYRGDARYAYRGGLNWRALAATLVGALTALAGRTIPGLEILWNGSWFSAGGAAFIVYLVLMPRPGARPDAPRPAA